MIARSKRIKMKTSTLMPIEIIMTLSSSTASGVVAATVAASVMITELSIWPLFYSFWFLSPFLTLEQALPSYTELKPSAQTTQVDFSKHVLQSAMQAEHSSMSLSKKVPDGQAQTLSFRSLNDAAHSKHLPVLESQDRQFCGQALHESP